MPVSESVAILTVPPSTVKLFVDVVPPEPAKVIPVPVVESTIKLPLTVVFTGPDPDIVIAALLDSPPAVEVDLSVLTFNVAPVAISMFAVVAGTEPPVFNVKALVSAVRFTAAPASKLIDFVVCAVGALLIAILGASELIVVVELLPNDNLP